jgi:hypothetical protein
MVGNFWIASLESNDGKIKLYIDQNGRVLK